MSSTPPTEVLSVVQERHENRARLQWGFVLTGAWQSCISCDDFEKGVCKRYNVTPPPEVLVVGCRDWDTIPF